jgi:hypothetical protein
MGLGLWGAGYAYMCCHLTSVTLLGGYIAWHSRAMAGSPRTTWGGFSSRAFSGWGEYLSYGIPTAVMVRAAAAGHTGPGCARPAARHAALPADPPAPPAPAPPAPTCPPALPARATPTCPARPPYPPARQISLEWWAYEVLILLAGVLPDAKVSLAVMGICLNISTW